MTKNFNMNSFQHLDPVPYAEQDLDVAQMTMHYMDASNLRQLLTLFFAIAIIPLFLYKIYPKKYDVLTYTQVQSESLENPSNHFLFILQNINSFHDLFKASFQIYAQHEKLENMTLISKISYVNRHWQETYPKIYQKTIRTNTSLPVEVFSTQLSDTRVVYIDVTFPQNTSALSRINCFIEYTPYPRIFFELFMDIIVTVLCVALFSNLYFTIQKVGYIRPAQFVTEFFLVLIIISSLPVDILRLFTSNYLVFVLKPIFNVISRSSIMCVFACYFLLIINTNSERQYKFTILNFAAIAFSTTISLGVALYESLFSPGTTNGTALKVFVEAFVLLVFCIYSADITNQMSDDRNLSIIYCALACSSAVLLLLSGVMEYLECHNSNIDLSFGIKSSTKLAICILLTMLHSPQIFSKGKGKSKRHRSQYRKQMQSTKLMVDTEFPDPQDNDDENIEQENN